MFDLRGCNMIIHHIAGELNVIADLFSRFLNPDYAHLLATRVHPEEFARVAVRVITRGATRQAATAGQPDAEISPVGSPAAAVTDTDDDGALDNDEADLWTRVNPVRQAHRNLRTDDFALGASLTLVPADASYPTI